MIFSIITATYNREKTIARSIKSVKSQSYSNIQHIVIDGKSNDKSIAIINKLLLDNDIFLSESDSGIYDALNKGLSLATGDVIGFMHSDDCYFNDEVLTKVANIFLDNEIDIVYGDACFFKNDDIHKIIRYYKSDRLSKKNLAWGKMPAHPAIFIRNRVYKKYGMFDTNFKIAGDYEFLCRLVSIKNFNSVYLSEPFVRMQHGGASTSGLKGLIIIFKEIRRALKNNSIYSNVFMLLSRYPSKIMQYFIKQN